MGSFWFLVAKGSEFQRDHCPNAEHRMVLRAIRRQIPAEKQAFAPFSEGGVYSHLRCVGWENHLAGVKLARHQVDEAVADLAPDAVVSGARIFTASGLVCGTRRSALFRFRADSPNISSVGVMRTYLSSAGKTSACWVQKRALLILLIFPTPAGCCGPVYPWSAGPEGCICCSRPDAQHRRGSA
jgi:hypothetical protein